MKKNFLSSKTMSFIFLRFFVGLKLWALHDEEAGEDVDEDPLHPRGHPVGLRGPEVNV